MRIRIQLLVFAIIGIGYSSCGNNGVGPVTPSTSQFIGMEGKLVTKLAYEKPYLYAGAAGNGLWRLEFTPKNGHGVKPQFIVHFQEK